MEFKIILIFYILGNINTFMFGTQKFQREYCFSKEITSNDQTITFNYGTTGEKKEPVDAVLRQLTPKKKDIYSTSKADHGNFKSNPLEQGKYNLCFYPYSTNIFSITFNFQTSEEEGDIKDIATDTRFKEMRTKMNDIKTGFRTMIFNSQNVVSGQFTHFLYLSNYIGQIRFLTFVKILIVGMVSLLQIYVIQKMFGDDKRMSQIKTNEKNNSKNDFL